MSQLFDRCVDSVLEVNEGVFRPEGGAELLTSDYSSFGLQELAEHLKWLFLNGYAQAGLEQFATAEIDFEEIEARAHRR
jgi:hypothetical protein